MRMPRKLRNSSVDIARITSGLLESAVSRPVLMLTNVLHFRIRDVENLLSRLGRGEALDELEVVARQGGITQTERR